jgi:DNA-binding response OmpR family regulator
MESGAFFPNMYATRTCTDRSALAEKKRGNVLIIEDERDLSLLLSIRLRNAGFNVSVAHDGEEGIETAVREEPDLVVLDLGLPELDGYGVLRVLRTVPMTCETPVIVLTGRRPEEIEKSIVGWNVVKHVLAKPIAGAHLARLAQAVLDAET